MRKFFVLLILLISVPAYAEVVCMSWEDKTDVGYWVDSPLVAGTWDGSQWTAEYTEAEDYIIQTDVLGTWAVDYRPWKARVTFTGVDSIIVEISGALGSIIVASGVGSGDEFVIPFVSDDMTGINFTHSTDPFSVTKIEFLVADDTFGSHRKLRNQRGWLMRGLGHDYPNR